MCLTTGIGSGHMLLIQSLPVCKSHLKLKLLWSKSWGIWVCIGLFTLGVHKTAVDIYQLEATIQQYCMGNSQAQQLQWLWMALSFCLMVKRNVGDIAEVTHLLFCFLSNATGLILDLEGDTEATPTSDLLSSKEPSWVMGRAAACQPWAALPVPPSRTRFLWFWSKSSHLPVFQF